ncbi:MAG: hypothetical protein HPY68_07655, partial [Candidatus Atribacteria bacterium]|nr:hypothetical protein [Candidatus Atribacteria bacterium]
NAAFLLWLCGRTSSVSQAFQFLEDVLTSGRALRAVEAIIDMARVAGVAS